MNRSRKFSPALPKKRRQIERVGAAKIVACLARVTLNLGLLQVGILIASQVCAMCPSQWLIHCKIAQIAQVSERVRRQRIVAAELTFCIILSTENLQSWYLPLNNLK